MTPRFVQTYLDEPSPLSIASTEGTVPATPRVWTTKNEATPRNILLAGPQNTDFAFVSPQSQMSRYKYSQSERIQDPSCTLFRHTLSDSVATVHSSSQDSFSSEWSQRNQLARPMIALEPPQQSLRPNAIAFRPCLSKSLSFDDRLRPKYGRAFMRRSTPESVKSGPTHSPRKAAYSSPDVRGRSVRCARSDAPSPSTRPVSSHTLEKGTRQDEEHEPAASALVAASEENLPTETDVGNDNEGELMKGSADIEPSPEETFELSFASHSIPATIRPHLISTQPKSRTPSRATILHKRDGIKSDTVQEVLTGKPPAGFPGEHVCVPRNVDDEEENVDDDESFDVIESGPLPECLLDRHELSEIQMMIVREKLLCARVEHMKDLVNEQRKMSHDDDTRLQSEVIGTVEAWC